MTYLKGEIIDKYQKKRTAYRIVEYDLNEDITTVENVLIYSRQYTRYIVDKQQGDQSSEIINLELQNQFIESNKAEYDRNIHGKKGKFNSGSKGEE
jgi:hypothetical protein